MDAGIEPDLLYDSCFPRLNGELIRTFAATVCSYNVHTYFTGGITSQNRTILTEDHLCAISCCCQSCRYPSRASTYHQNFTGKMLHGKIHLCIETNQFYCPKSGKTK